MNSFLILVFLAISLCQTFAATCGSFKTQAQCGTASKCFWEPSSGVCKCKDAVADYVFVIDGSGSIGPHNFGIQKQMVTDLLEQSIPANSGVGIILFSGPASPQVVYDLFVGGQRQTNITAAVIAVQNMPYPDDQTYMGGAIGLALSPRFFGSFFETRKNLRLFLVTDGQPNGPTNPCAYKDQIQQRAGLHVIILGVGTGFVESKVLCLVQKESNPADWIITISSYDKQKFQNVLPKLDTALCPEQLQLQITEVKPLRQLNTSVASGQGTMWFEFINSGSTTATLSVIGFRGLFSGFAADASSSVQSVAPGQVVVVYNDNGNKPTCKSCNCTKQTANPNWCANAIYIPCTRTCRYVGTGVNLTNWGISLLDWTSTTPTTIDAVAYDPFGVNGTWPRIPQGFTYELKQFLANNKKGSNWRQSCNEDGTPGQEPIKLCNTTCNVAQCRLNGNGGATCNKDTDKCKCSGAYYPAENTCLTLDRPPWCQALIKKVNTGHQLVFTWGTVSSPPGLDYEGMYLGTGSRGNQTFGTIVNDFTVVEYSSTILSQATFGSIRVKYVVTNRKSIITGGRLPDEVYYSDPTACTVKTTAPTPGPTRSPTTPKPTPPPIQLSVYVGGDICSVDRCSCNNLKLDCVGPAIIKRMTAGQKNFITITRLPYDFQTNVSVHFEAFPDKGSATGSNVTTRRLQSTGGSLSVIQNETCDATQGLCPQKGTVVLQKPGIQVMPSIRIPITITGVKYKTWYFRMLGCTTDGQKCDLLYPTNLTVTLEQPQAASSSITTNQTPEWLWWLIGALVLFLLLLALLAYQYWWKNRQTGAALNATKADLDHAIAENELGFAHDLDAGDVVFNPIATGVPGASNAPDFFSNEMAQRRGDAANQRADVPVEKFQHREQFGQIAGGNKPNDLAQPLLG